VNKMQANMQVEEDVNKDSDTKKAISRRKSRRNQSMAQFNKRNDLVLHIEEIEKELEEREAAMSTQKVMRSDS
jgi:hypothetical protein